MCQVSVWWFVPTAAVARFFVSALSAIGWCVFGVSLLAYICDAVYRHSAHVIAVAVAVAVAAVCQVFVMFVVVVDVVVVVVVDVVVFHSSSSGLLPDARRFTRRFVCDCGSADGGSSTSPSCSTASAVCYTTR